jgi:RHS repeat-associated protein
MLVSNKHFIPVIGLDIHIVILFGFPIPLPHPYIGFVLDPMDYIPFLGATTKVNHVPRGVSDTSGIIVILFHIPMGGPWLLAPMIGHDSVNFFGSKKVMVEGRMMSPSGHMLMTCNDIGLPLSLKPGKKLKPIPSMYLPTSFSIPLSFGKPVMVGGPFVPDWAGVLMNLVMSFGFGALMKGLGKLGRKLTTKFNHALKGKLGSNKLSKFLCKKGFEPVDLVQGIVMYDGLDFELPGPITLIWKRSWNSDSSHEGLLGHGTHLCYDMRVQEFVEEGATAVLLGDGRSAMFALLPFSSDSEYNRHEKLTLTRSDIDEFRLYNHEEQRYYTFRKTHPAEKQYRLSSIHNSANFIITLHYNSKGHLLRVTDSVGRHLHIENDTAGRITSVTVRHRGQEQLMVSYAYNEEGDLTTIADALEQSNHISFRNHLMVEKQDRTGQRFYWEYDAKKRCVHTWGDGGLLEGFIEYYPQEGYNLVTNSLGQTTTYYYTPDFVVHQVKDALGNSTFTNYTPDFEIYQEIDEEGTLSGYTYDERGNLASVVQPDGNAYSFSYNEDGNMILGMDPEGNSSSYIYYPSNGLLHTVTKPDGTIQVFRYNEQQLLSRVEDTNGNGTLMEYDEDLNLITMILPDGGIARWTYDIWGQCTGSSNPLNQKQTYRYDRLGRVTAMETPDGNYTQLEYDAYDQVLRASDKHHDVRFTYTPLGSVKTREENGSKTNYVYDTEDQLHTIVNEHGETYRFVRNARGEIIQETGFDGITHRFIRDTTGKVVKVERPDGKSTLYEYDYAGMLVRSEQHDGSWSTFNYDRNGQLIEAVNENSMVQFKRDALGRVVEEWQNGHIVKSSYDVNGKRTSLQSSLGARIQLQRNNMGDVTTMKAVAAGLKDAWSVQIQYNLLGLETERMLTGGVTSSMTYDQAGMPASHTVNNKTRTTRKSYYRWDANQQLRQMVNALNNSTVKFGHDDFGNLAWAQYEDGQLDYRQPDKVGNLYTAATHKDRKYSAGGQLKETPDARFEYDAEGFLVKKITADHKVWLYEWSAKGRLTKVTRPDNKTVSFEYDALGRRTAKIFQQKITRWVWDGDTPLHEWVYMADERPQTVIDELGNITVSPEPVPEETLITWVFEGDSHIPVAKIINGKQYSVISDYLGTPCQAYDEAGENIWSCELDIYGKVRKLAGLKGFIPFRYQGQYEDVETGLYYNRFRYYSPDEGSYISKDPIGLDGGSRAYSYVNDPTADFDLLGLHPVFDEDLAKIAREAHNVLKRNIEGKPEIGFNQSTVSIGEGTLPSGEKQLFASGNGAKLTPKQRQVLIDHGVPAENIYSGVAKMEQPRPTSKLKSVRKAYNLNNHAERVIIRNAPEGVKFKKWGISWGPNQKNEPCHNCKPHVQCAS